MRVNGSEIVHVQLERKRTAVGRLVATCRGDAASDAMGAGRRSLRSMLDKPPLPQLTSPAMKRLTLGVSACSETLALLVSMAWADGRLDEKEKAGVRGATQVFNLAKATRDRLEGMLAEKAPIDAAALGRLSSREAAFAYVAAAWMAGIDDATDAEERAVLDKVGSALHLPKERQQELEKIAGNLEPLPEGSHDWSQEITKLFKSIPPHLEGDPTEDFEVVFE